MRKGDNSANGRSYGIYRQTQGGYAGAHVAAAYRPNNSKRVETNSRDGFLSIANAFLIFWLIVGSFVAVVVAPCCGADESTHIARAMQVAQGVFLPQQVDFDKIDRCITNPDKKYAHTDLYGGETDKAVYDLMVACTPFVNGTDKNPSFPWWKGDRFSTIGSMGNDSVVWAFSNIAVNSPLSYVPYALACLVVRLITANPVIVVIAMRLAGVLTFGLLVRFAIKNTPVGKNVMLLVAILPVSIGVNSVITADMLANAVSLIYLSFILRFVFCYDRIRVCDFVGLGISICMLALLKMPSIVFGLLLFFIFVVNRMWEDRGHTAAIAVMGFTALVLFGLWSLRIRGIDTYVIWGVKGVDSAAQLSYMLRHPLATASAIMESIMNSDMGMFYICMFHAQSMPLWATVFALVCGVACDASDGLPAKRSRSLPVILLIVCAIFIVLLYVALYLTFTKVGASVVKGVQSRYYLPVIYPMLLSMEFICVKRLAKRRPREYDDDPTLVFRPCQLISLPMVGVMVLIFLFVIRMLALWLPFLTLSI